METQIKALITRHEAGDTLDAGEIRALMLYALGLLRYFEAQTLASIARTNKDASAF